VRWLTSHGPPSDLIAGVADTRWDYGHPTYYSSSGDPRFRLHCTEPWGVCPIEGDVIPIPRGARPAGGTDGHMAIVDVRAGWEYDLWQARSRADAHGGVMTLSWGGRTRIEGTGLDSDATAAHFGLLAGVIRAPELQAGHIDHALLMVTRCTSGYVPPALAGGSRCSASQSAPKAGMRIQLHMSTRQIDHLAVANWKRTILRAMARYGAIIGDTGGSAAWGLQLESGSTYTSFGKPDRLVRFARAQGVPEIDGEYIFALGAGVDWAKYLRVIAPCSSARSCR
jgi:hypothetical protein